jgi:hypothetical protein
MVLRLNQTSTPFNMSTPLNMTLKAADLGPPDDSGITFEKWAIGGIVLVLIVVIMLVIATTSIPRIRFVQGVHSIFRRNKGKQPILPTTNTPQQPQPILARRQTERMERLKTWQKPAIPPPSPLPDRLQQSSQAGPSRPFAGPSRPTNRFDSATEIEMQHISEPTQPDPTHSPRRSAYQNWLDRARRYRSSERHRRARETPQYLDPVRIAYWQQETERMMARRSWWEKLKNKFGYY